MYCSRKPARIRLIPFCVSNNYFCVCRLLSDFEVSLFIECWKSDPHHRPSFEQILDDLDVIVHSSFTQTPHESFHVMQEDWREEIEEVLLELRRKEKVGTLISFCTLLKNVKVLILETNYNFISFHRKGLQVI